MNINDLLNNAWFFIILGIWEIIWKGFGLWKAAKNNKKYWFIAILAINTIGVLPIIYLKFFQKKK